MKGPIEVEKTKDILLAVAVAGGESFHQVRNIRVDEVVPFFVLPYFYGLAPGRRVADFAAMSVKLYRISRKAFVDIVSILSEQSHTALQHLRVPPALRLLLVQCTFACADGPLQLHVIFYRDGTQSVE